MKMKMTMTMTSDRYHCHHHCHRHHHHHRQEQEQQRHLRLGQGGRECPDRVVVWKSRRVVVRIRPGNGHASLVVVVMMKGRMTMMIMLRER